MCASSISLASDFNVERGYLVVGAITNDGSVPLSDVTVRYHIGHSDSGGQQIGQDSMIPLVPTGVTVFDSISWIGFTGGSRLYMQVDPASTIQEDNEQDNECCLAVVLRDDVSWVWQVVNGYCNYAALTMLFNFNGANQTVYETVELANCPHSAVYADDHFYLPGGIMISQTTSDYEFAGDMNLQTFESVFQELLDALGGDLNATLQTLAQFFADGMFWTQIGWEASEEYYGTFGSENADRIAELSGDLALVADRIFRSFVDLLTAVGNSGGNTDVAAPYLSEIAADLEEIVLAEEDMLPAVVEFLATGAEKQPIIHSLDGEKLFCMPNPFPASTLIRFASPKAGVVSIYDMNGRRIRTLSGISGQDQWITTRWDGRNAANQPMPAGTYVIRAKGAESVRIVKTR